MVEFFYENAPSYWASYLINGDSSGISPEEKQHADKWLENNQIAAVIDLEEESIHFTWSYRLYDTLADCEGGEIGRYTVTYKEQ